MKSCLSLAESSNARLQEKLASYSDRCDLIETRLDFLKSPDVPVLPDSSRTQFIATCRPMREGGHFSGNEDRRLELLLECASAGFNWVDLELDSELPESLPSTCRLIRSHHEFGRFPDLPATLQALRQRGGDLFKIAASIQSTAQLTRLLAWMESLDQNLPRVVIGMGALGQASRFLGEPLGNAWTYVSEPGAPVAPGQFDLAAVDELSGDAPTALYALLGRPVAHSFSPCLHNRLFRSHGLPSWYLALELDDLDIWFAFLRRTKLPFEGFSVTLPFKTEILPFLCSVDSPTPSINTLRRVPEGWAGSNTDLPGFLEPLWRRRFEPGGASAVVLGNGGVAHTVVSALLEQGAAVTVLGRNARKLEAFAGRYGCDWDTLSRQPIQTDLLINTTPVGQFPLIDDCLLQPGQFQAQIVYDLIYNPPETRLLRLASETGCQTISGIEMFVEQAALQFEAWAGIRPDRGAMENWLLESVARAS